MELKRCGSVIHTLSAVKTRTRFFGRRLLPFVMIHAPTSITLHREKADFKVGQRQAFKNHEGFYLKLDAFGESRCLL